MSRSFRKTPIFGHTTAESEKEDKRMANRATRRAVKIALKIGKDVLPDLREKGNVYNFAKDGKSYWISTEKTRDDVAVAMRK